jgi:membrane protease YdiL (CAAX protease family)
MAMHLETKINIYSHDNLEYIPSNFFIIAVAVVYLFSSIPIVVSIGYLLKIIGLQDHIISSAILYIENIIQILISITLTIFILNRNYTFILSKEWKSNYLIYIKSGLIWSSPLAIFIITHLASLHFGVNEINHSINRYRYYVDQNSLNILLYFIILTAAAFTEETIFRGMILNKLLYKYNAILSVLISSILFSISHFICYYDFHSFLSTFIVGLLSGFSFLSSRSIISSVIPHFINNIIYAYYNMF